MKKAKNYFERLNKEINKKNMAITKFKALAIKNLTGDASVEDFKEWDKVEEALMEANSTSNGTYEAIRCWENFEKEKPEYIEVKDYIKEKDIEDLINHFKNAGIKEFVYSYTGTDAITNLFEFQKAGCIIDKAIEYSTTKYFITDYSKGMLIKIK